MLTKEFLKYRVRSGRVFPSLVSAQNQTVANSLAKALETARRFEGATLKQLQDEMEAEDHFQRALVDVIVGNSESEDAQDITGQRWNWLLAAEELRQELELPTIEDFDRELSLRVESPASTVKDTLYSDLPEMTKITSIRTFSPDELAKRYNLEQIKGLLLRARGVSITLERPSISESRFLLRMLKFHQLIAEIDVRQNELRLDVSGSLEIFGVTQTSFGRNITKFFGYLTKISRWKMRADLVLKGRTLELLVDHNSALSSDHAINLQYVPEEFKHFMQQLAKNLPGWHISSEPEVLNLGGQVYSVPDFALVDPTGKQHFIELFHRFHHGQLKSRLRQWISSKHQELILGISTKLGLDDDAQALLENACKSGLRTFRFRDFPTPRAVLPLIQTNEMG